MTLLTTQKGLTEVSIGQPAPDFVARDLNDKSVSLKSIIGRRRALLIFYRGGWCPFCNQQLAAISQDYSKFKELDTTVVAVSCEEIEKGKRLLQKLALPYALLSDTQFEGIDRYGVRETNPSEQLRASGITSHSKPSSFIIDESGIVRYKYVGKNAQDRPKNEDLLRVLAEIAEST
jgi:peroxiredoxin